MAKNYLLTLLLLILPGVFPVLGIARAQEVRIFKVSDFDLKGKVKHCLVSTDYGKEEFEFNRNGLLTKSVTRYNEGDYDITIYTYEGEYLAERRDEVYRDGSFDKKTSIAHFYEVDTTSSLRIVEKIFSYNKEFLDQFEYEYDEDGKLKRILRSNNEGVDETTVEYSEYKGEKTVSYFLNEVLLSSVRESERKNKDGSTDKLILTKEFINGVPVKAKEEAFNPNGKLISETSFEYDPAEKSFIQKGHVVYLYEKDGRLKAVKTTNSRGNTHTKEYIFQFDGAAEPNWVKQIITPDNAYTTRRITYFKELPVQVEEP